MPTQPLKFERNLPVVTDVMNCTPLLCARAAGRHQPKQTNREKATRGEIFMRTILVAPQIEHNVPEGHPETQKYIWSWPCSCCLKYFVPRCPVQAQFSASSHQPSNLRHGPRTVWL